MNWYITKIVFQIICGNGDHTAQFDEQLRLVFAESKEKAFTKAQQMGKKEEESFFNTKEELVQWQFVNVCEVYKLSGLIDGAELYSRIEERDDADIYVDIINKKASGIIHSDSHELLQLV